MLTPRVPGCLLVLIYLLGCHFIPSAGSSSLDTGTISIGVLAPLGKETCFQQWEPTAAYLKRQLPQFKLQILCLDYDEVDRAVSEKTVDFTITNPSMYVSLEHQYGVSRLSTLKNRSSATSYTQLGGVIFSRADRTDIKTVEDLKGKRFMAVAENSFGGWQVVWRYLKDRGVDPHHDFQELVFGGRHDSVVSAVKNGTVDVGCVRTDTLEHMAKEQKIDLNDFTIVDPREITPAFSFLRTTRLYPEWPLAKARHTGSELAKQVALVMMQMPADSPAARSSRTMGWTIPMDYQEVHDCLRLLKVQPYADFGTITFDQLYRQYYKWILVGIIFLVCISGGLVLVLNLNRRLKTAIVNLDVEHRQRAQLVADLDEFKLTLDQTLDCVFMFAADTLRFIYANQGALNHIGYSREELLRMTPLDFKPGVMEPQYRAMIAHLKDKPGTSLTYASMNQRKDGTIVPVEVFLQHITPPRKQGRFVAIVRDITVRRQKEAERESLRSRLLQEQKMASVGQLAAGIAHEINTPAQYLGSNIDFLNEAFVDVTRLIEQFDQLLGAAKDQEVPPQLVSAAGNILEEADWPYLKEEIPLAIKQSIDGVKQVSSIVLAMKNFAHPGGADKEMTDLNELLKTTLTVSRNEWKYVAEPSLRLDPQLPPVPCRRNEMGQVFLNIIVNAAHSIAERLGPDPGSQKGQITISSNQVGIHAVVTVTDSGSGISQENLGKIFDPFFTTKKVGKGTGQGLTIAYDIVTNQHGGDLEVTSEEGVGTTFTIALPVDPSLPDEEGNPTID